jgi:hypothetical protein
MPEAVGAKASGVAALEKRSVTKTDDFCKADLFLFFFNRNAYYISLSRQINL